ncbi:MAG: hypothetical protein Q9209_000650 [Squamulea sp. 1 TL-2023]
MPLVPPSPTTPTRKEKGTQFPEDAGSSWSRHWIAQHPPKASKPEVTVYPPSLVGVVEEYPQLSTIEHISPLHQILPLYPLPSIAESPKQEARLEAKPEAISLPLLSTQVVQQANMSTIQVPRRPSESENSTLTNESKGETQEIEMFPLVTSIPPLSPIAEAAGIPLPSSPALEDSPDHLSSNNGQERAKSQGVHSGPSTVEAIEPASRADNEGKDTWASRLNSILPNAIMDRPSRQSTGITNARASRSSSVAPGAYPESDSTEESLKQNHDQQAEDTRPKIDTTRPDEKSVRSRKSVSIVLPGERNETTRGKEDDKEGITSLEEHSNNSSPSNPHDNIDRTAKTKQNSDEDISDRNGYAPNVAKVAVGPKASTEQAEADVSAKLLQTPIQREASVKSRASSIAASHNDTERSDISTLHEQESLAPSDADNSSLMPLLSSSPGDARSSHFSESLDENHTNSVVERPSKNAEQSQKEAANSPSIVDELSSISTVDSPTSSKTARMQKRPLEYPFPPGNDVKGSSNAASSLPPPKIVIKDATSPEGSQQTPPLVAPTTTPVQDGHTPPQLQTMFGALGESPMDERAVKLPVKGRKLYVRKFRYAVLRRPVLNAVLGRQVGAQAKVALKKLANGELIVMEPPATL